MPDSHQWDGIEYVLSISPPRSYIPPSSSSQLAHHTSILYNDPPAHPSLSSPSAILHPSTHHTISTPLSIPHTLFQSSGDMLPIPSHSAQVANQPRGITADQSCSPELSLLPATTPAYRRSKDIRKRDLLPPPSGSTHPARRRTPPVSNAADEPPLDISVRRHRRDGQARKTQSEPNVHR